MPKVNFCKKCGLQTPPGDKCPYCGRKLAKNGEMLSFGLASHLASDWLTWQRWLKILVPVYFGVVIFLPIIIWILNGFADVKTMFSDGYLLLMLLLLCIVLLLTWLRFDLMGIEYKQYLVGNHGISERIYLKKPTDLALWLRLLSREDCEKLQQQDDSVPLQGYLQIHRRSILWESISKVTLKKEKQLIIIHDQSKNQIFYLRTIGEDWQELTSFVTKKLKKNKDCTILNE